MREKRLISLNAVARAGTPAAVALALLVGLAPVAAADDPPPSADKVRQAHEHLMDKAADAGRIQGELDRASAELHRLDVESAKAVEAYNGAMVRQRKAQQLADAARQRAEAADRALTDARSEVGRLAAHSYRLGPGAEIGALEMLVTSSDPAEAATRMESMRRVAVDRNDVLLRTATALREAAEARKTADSAVAEARKATDEVVKTKEQVELQFAGQQRLVDAVKVRQDKLLAELAAARRTSLDLERRRQEALAAEAVRRAARDAASSKSVGVGQNLYRKSATTENARTALDFALAQLGKPYLWGGEGPDRFDCSGLVMRAWEKAGVQFTHFAATQYYESTPVAYNDLRPGDLIFWSEGKGPDDIHHVAIYLGDRKMVHAPRTGAFIRVDDMFYMGKPDYYGRP